ncbi:MAG TPA: O-acetyl-ADP-ribose deacetylase [Gemmatimonadaceae bacterium]|nr:O-acetyl-ADP-ribose deacetylase [Gemmatimonadaceae bacterium]
MELRAILADITCLQVDAIVNAANSALIPGGGVDGAINRAAGPQLGEAMRALGGCPTGESRITPGFRLHARYVIHAVGPIWRGGNHGEAALLASAYRSALILAREHGCKSIAFPAISTGVYGYPAEKATRVAVETCRGFATEAESIEIVQFACFSEEMLQLYRLASVPT